MNRDNYIHVTTALSIIRKYGLEKWKGDIGNFNADKIAKQEAELGTLVHEQTAILDRGEIPCVGLHSSTFPMIAGYEKWQKENIRRVLFVEKPIYDDDYQYQGRPDLIAESMKGNIGVYDRKTGPYYKEQDLQLALYREAANKTIMKEIGLKITESWIIRIFKDEKNKGIVTAKLLNDHKRAYRHGLYALSLYRYFN